MEYVKLGSKQLESQKKKKIKTDFLSTKSAKDHKAGIGVFTKQ